MKDKEYFEKSTLQTGYCEVEIKKILKNNYAYEITFINSVLEGMLLKSSNHSEQNNCYVIFDEIFTQKKLKSYYNVAVNHSYMEFKKYCTSIEKHFLVKVKALSKERLNFCFEEILTETSPNLKSNKSFSTIMDNSFDYFLILNKDLQISYCNNNAKELLGIKAEFPTTNIAFEYVHPDDRTIGEEAIAELLTKPNQIYSSRIRIKDAAGSYKVMYFRIKNEINLEGINGFLINARDVTDKKAKELEEIQDKIYLKSLLQAIPNLIFVLDFNGNFLDFKAPTDDILAFEPEDFIGRNISKLFPPYISNKLCERLISLKKNLPIDSFSYVYRNKNGENRNYECTLSKIDEFKVLAIVNDITTLKKAELTLKNSQRDIQRKLDAIISPEGSISNLELADLINIDELKDLFETIFDFTQIPITLLDRRGNNIFSIGSTNICHDFHLFNKDTLKKCQDSNKNISQALRIGESKLYECFNNVSNFATPIFVGNERIATLLICQFRLADSLVKNEEVLRRAANLYSFDKDKYLAAYYKLPIIDKNLLIKIASYYRDLLSKITALSFAQIKQARTAQQLRLREEKLAHITDNMTDIIFINDLNFNVLYVSPSVEKVYGFTPEEYLRRKPQERFPQDIIEKITRTLKNELSKENYARNSVIIEIKEYNAKNDLIDISVHAKILLDNEGNAIGIIGSARDICQEKKMEKEINYQLKLQSLLSSIAMKYINLPLEMIDLSIQKSLEEFALFTKADRAYIFKYFWEENYTSNTYEWCKDGIEAQIDKLQKVPIDLMKEWNKAHKLGKLITIADVTALPDDDERKKFLLAQDIKSILSVPLMDRDECIGFVGFDSVKESQSYNERDITVLQVFANLLVNIYNRQDMAKNLQNEKERATESDKLKSNLLKNISHEFRTPLNGIIGFSELLKSKDIDTDYQKVASMIFNSASRLNYVLDSVMLLAQLESISEIKSLNLEVVDLSSLLETLANHYLGQAEQKGLELVIDIPKNIPALVNENLFKQAVTHIINNAIKYTHKGKIAISIQISPDREFILLNISDTGIGIPFESQDIIFSDFRQVSEGYNRAYEGCGLGLPIAKKAIELMHGQILLESDFGKGASFTIMLPFQNLSINDIDLLKKEIKNRPRSKPIALKKDQPSILIVEDNMINQKLALSILRSYYNIDIASDGETAINLTTQKQYDAILMDIHLGQGLDGIETTKIIRNDIRYIKTPIIAVTGYTMLGDKDHILKEGCSHYLSKPYSKQELLDIVFTALHNLV